MTRFMSPIASSANVLINKIRNYNQKVTHATHNKLIKSNFFNKYYYKKEYHSIISIVVKEAIAQYAFYIARKTDNVSIKADGWHHRTDALSSLVVLIGILFANQFWWIDSVLGIIISFMLFYATFQIAKEAINKLLGEKPSSELIEKIRNSIQQYDLENIQLHHFHIHNYGGHRELTFHIKLRNDLSIEGGHRIATEIENIIQEKFGIVSTIHVEPMTFNHNSD